MLLAKPCPFTQQEIDAAEVINEPNHQRTILLTSRELEPGLIYERTKAEFEIEPYASSASDLARTTAAIYFGNSTQYSTS